MLGYTEYDLNDPDALKKDKPARVGDDDARCGPASMQLFDGEDLGKAARVAALNADVSKRARVCMRCDRVLTSEVAVRAVADQCICGRANEDA